MGQEYTLLGLVSLEPGTWADWFSGSMSALAVAVALSAYPIANCQKKRANLEREKEIGAAIGNKLTKLMSRNEDINRHIKLSLAGERMKLPPQFRSLLVRPLGIPDWVPQELNQSEIDFLLRSRSSELLVELDLCHGRYLSILFAMKEFKVRHEALFELLPPPVQTEGTIFSHQLDMSEVARVRPFMLMMDSMLSEVESLLQVNEKALQLCLSQYQTDMTRHFGKPLMSFYSREPEAETTE
jgi:hypothetical protein